MNQAEAIAAAQKLGPEWKWVAMDPNGVWYAYNGKSEALEKGEYIFWTAVEGGSCERLGATNTQWLESISEAPQ